MNYLYSKVYNYQKNIKPAPNPFYLLEKFSGNLNIQEYRELLNSERMLIIIDKPLVRQFPEIHEENEMSIINKYNSYNINTIQKYNENFSNQFFANINNVHNQFL